MRFTEPSWVLAVFRMDCPGGTAVVADGVMVSDWKC
jgi:hypothetical protein